MPVGMPFDAGAKGRPLRRASIGSGSASPRTSRRRDGRDTSLRSCTMTSVPVAPRATRMASMVASVPELRTARGRAGSAGTAPRPKAPWSRSVTAKWVPVRDGALDGGDDGGMGVAHRHGAKAVVEVDVARARRRPIPRRPGHATGRSGYGSAAWNDEATPMGIVLLARSNSACDSAFVPRARRARWRTPPCSRADALVVDCRWSSSLSITTSPSRVWLPYSSRLRTSTCPCRNPTV